MTTELCPRCHGGDIPAQNCPICGGSDFITGEPASTLSLPSPFSKGSWRSTRAEREKEKARRVKVFKVSLTPEEQARLDQEERQRRGEAEARLARLNRVANKPRNAKDRYKATKEGAVAMPEKPSRSARPRLEPSTHNASVGVAQPPSSRGPKPSKWSTPEHSKKRRVALEAKLAAQLGSEKASTTRVSRKDQSAASVGNDQLAQQLASFLDSSTPKEQEQQGPKDHLEHETPKPHPADATTPPQQLTRRHTPCPSPAERRQERKARAKAKAEEKAKTCRKVFTPVRNGRLVSDPDELAVGPSESHFTSLKGERQRGGSTKGLPGDDSLEQAGSPAVAVLAENRHREEDGGRYYGTSFRESDGSFGSLPLYDDYDN